MRLHCILILLSLLSATFAANCNGAASKLAVTEFDAFPSPVEVGGTVYIRANINPSYPMGDAKVKLSVYYTDKSDVSGLDPILEIPALDFCHLSTAISCPLPAGPNILSWEYTVPDLLAGTYQIRYTIVEINPSDDDPYSCIQFSITVSGQRASTYNSWYQATLLGTALFTQEDHTNRVIGEYLQVGPEGPLNNTVIPAPNYGNIKFLKGSGDLVPNAYYDTSNFVWGLYGNMTGQTTRSSRMTHIYEGHCYLGYINNDKAGVTGNYYDYVTPLLEGVFWLNWTYTDNSKALINGYATFNPVNIPYGWGYPLLYGRLGRHEIVTSDVGFLMIKGSTPFCPSGVCKAPLPDGQKKSNGLSKDKLGLAIGLPIAVVFVVVLVLAALFYIKRRRETEQEDGIFAAARKPEYGSALVVDDIIEETRGSKTLQAMLDIRDEVDLESGNDSDSGSERAHSRSRSASRSLSRSASSRSNSRSKSRARSESDAGDSASRASDSD